MKYPVVIFVLLLSSAFCQELIVDSLTTAYTSGTAFAKSYQYSQWNSVTDFAIYGWFKISSQYARNEWATAFHFTANGNDWSDYAKNGDRVLAFFTINDQLHNPTYSLANGNTNYYNNLSYQAADLDKWAFTYVSIGNAQQAQFAYYKLGSSGESSKKLSPVTHGTSSFYQIKVGQSFGYKYFPGSIWRLSIIGGPSAYKESGFDVVQNVKPDQAPSCPIIFSGCAQSGTATNVCQNIPVFNVKTIQGVYLPSGYTLTIFDTNNYAGKKITYNQSIECITSFNWAMLVNTNAITIEDDDRPTLRKSSKKSKNNN